MAQLRQSRYRLLIVVAILFAGVLLGVRLSPAVADVTAVKGGADGYLLKVSLFGSPVHTDGPVPTVTLPPAGAASPVTGSGASANVTFGPATFFTSDALNVSTQGTTGPSGTVTSSSTVANVGRGGSEVFTADTAASTCTASETGVSATTTITNGVIQTDSGDTNPPVHPRVTQPVPANPTANTSVSGHIHVNGSQDNFHVIFNEQVTNADGSITVTAAHQVFDGPTAVGDLWIGRSTCGVTAVASTTTTTTAASSTTTTAPPGTTTTTVPTGTTTTTTTPTGSTTTTTTPTGTTTTTGATTTTTTAPTTTTTTLAGQVSGSAYGFYTNISLFGAPFVPQGPAPTVALPAAGSTTPVTATAPTGSSVLGPAIFFNSGPITVSTKGTAAGGSVTSSTSIAGCTTAVSNGCMVGEVFGGSFTAGSVAGTCTASPTGVSGSATFTNAKLVTATNAAGDPVTTVPVPDNPPANDTINGTLQANGSVDNFKWVFNEQVVNPQGTITVNAAHQYLLGPTGKGDVIIGQSVCAWGGSTSSSTTTTTTTAPAGPATTSTTAATTVTQVGGSAYGSYVNISLFGGPFSSLGPAPKVTLPAAGSSAPVTASAPTGNAVFGPAILFNSGPVTVSTQGTPAGGSVTSSTSFEGCATAVTNGCMVGEVFGGSFTAGSVASTCTASSAGLSGSTTFTNAKLATSTNEVGDPATTVQVPANPPANDTINGTLQVNGSLDTFKWVFNEQMVNPQGSITVNAAHQYLFGPTGRGDVIIGQAFCARSVSASSGSGGLAATPLAATGGDVALLLELALVLLITGWSASRGAADIRWRGRSHTK